MNISIHLLSLCVGIPILLTFTYKYPCEQQKMCRVLEIIANIFLQMVAGATWLRLCRSCQQFIMVSQPSTNLRIIKHLFIFIRQLYSLSKIILFPGLAGVLTVFWSSLALRPTETPGNERGLQPTPLHQPWPAAVRDRIQIFITSLILSAGHHHIFYSFLSYKSQKFHLQQSYQNP